jgi:hypothetical protein
MKPVAGEADAIEAKLLAGLGIPGEVHAAQVVLAAQRTGLFRRGDGVQYRAFNNFFFHRCMIMCAVFRFSIHLTWI